VPSPPAVATLDCPRCGAPASLDSARCAYCQAALALVGCPRCLGRVFSGAHFCQHCGTALQEEGAPLAEASSPLACPRCPPSEDARLAARQLGRTRLSECPRCGGTWLDAHTVAALVSEHDQQAALRTALPGLAGPGAVAPKGPEAVVRYLQCPSCARLMNRQNFGRRSGVVVDVCRAHGVWFDAGELSAVVAFVMRGGLDEARKQELEEAREALRRRHEAAEESSGPTAYGLGAAFPSAAQSGGTSLLDFVFRFLG
jgi:Zn-finger nucleic acid-binding protein